MTIFAVVLGAIYLSGGADPLVDWVAEKFFKAEAKAEAVALEKAGEGKVEEMLKGEFDEFLFWGFAFHPLYPPPFFSLEGDGRDGFEVGIWTLEGGLGGMRCVIVRVCRGWG